MASRTKTVEFAFGSDTTTLASATRRDLTAITLYLPETTSRTFRSVHVEANFRGDETVAASVTATLVGIKLGAAAFSDTTNTVTWTNTGDPQSHTVRIDVTSYFTSNFGAGASQTCQVGMSITGIATANHTAKVVITYSYSDADDTRVKTVRIPLESSTALLTNTLASIGSNQVPDLDALLPEGSKVYRQIWFECLYNEAGNATTDFNLEVALDAEAGVDIARCEQALNGAPFGVSRWVRNDMDTTAAHDFKARSDNLTSRIQLAVILCVTYEYSHSGSSSIMNSLVIPFGPDRGQIRGTTGSGERWREQITVWIEEPTTITLAQSGILFVMTEPSTVTLSVLAGAQSGVRSYAQTAGSVECGPRPFCHRIDSGSAVGSAITLARGENVLDVDVYDGAAGTGGAWSGCLFLNYTSGKASDDGQHNHSCCFLALPNTNATSSQRLATMTSVPTIEETSYFVNRIGFDLRGTLPGLAVTNVSLAVEAGFAENAGAGWHLVLGPQGISHDGELAQVIHFGNAEYAYDRWAGDPAARMDPETSRSIALQSGSAMTGSAVCWLTHHAITYTIAGDITGSAGGTVQIGAHRVTGEKVASTSRVGNGAFSMTWYDDTEELFVEARESGTLVGRSDNDTAS